MTAPTLDAATAASATDAAPARPLTFAARAKGILLAALALGIGGDLLLGEEGRLGLALWVGVVVAGAIVVESAESWRARSPASRGSRILLLSSLLLAGASQVLRDDEQLQGFTVLAILCLGATLAWQGARRALAVFAPEDAFRATFHAIRSAAFGAPAVLRAGLAAPADAGEERTARVARRRDLIIGTVIAVPVLIGAGALLANADPVLGAWFTWITELISEEALQHLFRTAVITWAAIGWLAATAGIGAWEIGDARDTRQTFASAAFTLIAPTLYGLVVLLALFLGVQARVLFGGAEYLAATAGLTVAEYARDGFFDLVGITAVVLGVLLVADHLLHGAKAEDRRHFRVSGGLLLALVTVPIISAVVRMALYVRYFGLTTDRFYALAGMAGIAGALAVFAATVLRDRSDKLGGALVVTALLWLGTLHVLGPERIVVRANVARAVAGAPFDVEYHRQLSADAFPALGAALAVIPQPYCGQLATMLEQERAKGRFVPEEWTGWSLPRRAAQREAVTSCADTPRPVAHAETRVPQDPRR